MRDTTEMLREINLQTLGRFLMEGGTPFGRELREELTEKQVRLFLEDDLRLALRHGGEDLEGRVREVVDETWEKGKMVGFMTGMRAGARVVLSLLGEGEILI